MKGICHTDIEFDRVGLESLSDHIDEYFKGTQLVPVSRTKNNINEAYLYFAFSNELLKMLKENPSSLKKPYETALKYGFRGYSKGGRNGIFYQRKQDSGLIHATNKLIERHKDEIEQFFEHQGELTDIRKIKIVTHNTKGYRVVGVYDEKKSKAVFLDIAKY